MADYPSSSTTKRSSAVKVMLHPDMLEKLKVLAEHLGQTPSTLASIAVSQYVAQQTVALGATEKAIDGFLDRMTPEVLNPLLKLLLEPSGASRAPLPKAVEGPLIGRPGDLFKAAQRSEAETEDLLQKVEKRLAKKGLT